MDRPIIGRKCGACELITSEREYQAMKFSLPCPNPRCPDKHQAYRLKVYAGAHQPAKEPK